VCQWWGLEGSGVRGRVLAEEYARDSFENLLFSVCRFKVCVCVCSRVYHAVSHAAQCMHVKV
jgi:hypothetical protein